MKVISIYKNLFIFLCLGTVLFSGTDVHYVGDKSCVGCHAKEVHEWKGSDHDMAMKKPTMP